ncbi:YdcF family protein [Rhodococcus sp. IEGM 1409]|nr:YdcF family protein [Rhodococcus sp. IEGM 1409]MDI9898535.1 YdcF family protein [Rhodococcus sp. IEGM 1409]
MRGLVALAFALIAVTAVGWPVYVTPKIDAPEKADAIVVLGGDHDGREEYGLSLAEQGFAPQIVFSNPYRASDTTMKSICEGHYDFDVSCFKPDPSTTRGEGQEIRRRAEAEGWKRVIVVTFVPHVSRSRYIIGKCWDGEIRVVADPQPLPVWVWAANYVWQTAGYVRAQFESC